MITLRQGIFPVDHAVTYTLAEVMLHGRYRAAAWSNGSGPWLEFLTRPVGAGRYTLIDLSGQQKHLTRAEASQDSGYGIRTVLLGTAIHLFARHQKLEDISCCVLMRPRSVIPIGPDGSGSYLVSPMASAHQVLDDIRGLEHEFPGVFEIV